IETGGVVTRECDGPPRLAEWLLERALASAAYREDIVGDLHEAYGGMTVRFGRRTARLWYGAHAIRLALRYGGRALFLSRTAGVESRHSPGGTLMDRLLMDIRYAVRSLLKHPTTAA